MRFLLTLLVVFTGAVSVACVSGGQSARPSHMTAAQTVSSTTSVPTTTSTTTTTTAPPNDLLAPPPTVVPPLEVIDGRAPLVSRVETTDRVIFVTIDDGQIRDQAALDHLKQLGIPFTSFLLQTTAQAAPEFWKSSIASGGTTQTHSINHPNLRGASEDVVQRELCEPADAFTTLFGERPTLFRPPYGNYNDLVRRVAAECGYRAVVLWTGSVNDGVLTMQQATLKPGDIILMHFRNTLIADVDAVVARARAEGFRFGRLEDYLAPK